MTMPDRPPSFVREPERAIAPANALSLRSLSAVFGSMGTEFGRTVAAELDEQAESFDREAIR